MWQILPMLVAALVPSLGVTSPAGPVNQPPYPVEVPIVASSPTVRTGGSVQISGQGFHPGEAIVITSVPSTGSTTATANASGAFTASIKVSQSGTHVFTATGSQSGHVGFVTVEVVGAQPVVAQPQMPVTGTDDRVMNWEVPLGVLILTLGIALVFIARRRTRNGANQA